MTGNKKRGSRKECPNHIKLKHPVTMLIKYLNNSKWTRGRTTYVTTQEENAYQKYHPKHFASSMTPPDVCEFSEVLAN